MGNYCLPKTTAINRNSKNSNSSNNPPAAVVVHLHGPTTSPATFLILIALSYKRAISVRYHPSHSPDSTVQLRCGADSVAGSVGNILRYVDMKLPGPTFYAWPSDASVMATTTISARRSRTTTETAATVAMVRLQHRSLDRQLDRIAALAAEMAAGSGCGNLEMRRLESTYAQLVEILLEHARMEETLVFPLLERADRGSCKESNEEHARDLPIINGIKEDIKSIIALEVGNASYQEALLNLSLRLNTLTENCREHFAREEEDLLPLLEVLERGGGGEKEVVEVEDVVMGSVMESTHSHLFHVLIRGLLPHEAVQYLEIVCRCGDQDRLAKMLSTLAAKMEAAFVGSSLSSSALHWGSSHPVRQVAC